MSKPKLIRQTELDDLLDKIADTKYLQSLSDKDILKLYSDANQLRYFYMLMQSVAKELANSVYGGFGTASLRYFLQAVAEDITGEGREHCKMMDKTANLYFSKLWPVDFDWHKTLREKFPTVMRDIVPKAILKDIVVYADTDSNYLTFDYVFESLGLNAKQIDIQLATEFIVFFMRTKMDPLYDKVLKTSISSRNGNSTMVFELEQVGGFSIWAAKKKYVMAKLWTDGKFLADKKQIKSTGIELAQKSSPLHVRKIIQTFVNTIFVRKGDIDSNLFFGMCKSVKDRLSDAKAEDLAKSGNLGKYNEYVISDKEVIKLRPKCPISVRGSARYNQLVYQNGLQASYPYLKSGMRVKLYYDTSGQPFCYPVDIEFPEDIAPPISVDIQLEKLIFSPVKRLVSGGLIDGDLSKMGSSKIQKGFSSMFNKIK